jgi:hypothetical protein
MFRQNLLNSLTMRKSLFYLLAAFALVAVSCSKDDPAPAGPTLATSAEAKAEHDNKSGGIYKGTFANATTSGTIKVILQEGKKEIIISYNGATRTLTTADLASWTSGDAITTATFASTDWQVVFNADGDAATFSFGLSLGGVIDFDGLIVKEISTAQVRVYEGTYAGDSSGKWNFCSQGSQLAGVYTGTSSGSFEGTISGNNITITSSGSSVTAAGTFTNELVNCSGTWASGSGDSGTWSGARKI